MELEETRNDFQKQGLGVAAISYDSQELLRYFAERMGGFSYPLLSDPESNIMRDFGILNDNIPEGHEWYGIPFPGTFIVDAKGQVISKYFEQMHRQRFTADAILVKEFGEGGGKRTEVRTDHLTLEAYASQDEARRGNRITLAVDVKLPEKMHLYAPGVKGYRPVRFEIDELPSLLIHDPDFPDAKMLRLEVIKETVPVYESNLRVLRDVTISPRYREETLEITGRFHYQACDDKVCYAPLQIPLSFTLQLDGHDGERAPESLRKKPGSPND